MANPKSYDIVSINNEMNKNVYTINFILNNNLVVRVSKNEKSAPYTNFTLLNDKKLNAVPLTLYTSRGTIEARENDLNAIKNAPSSVLKMIERDTGITDAYSLNQILKKSLNISGALKKGKIEYLKEISNILTPELRGEYILGIKNVISEITKEIQEDHEKKGMIQSSVITYKINIKTIISYIYKNR